MNTEITQDVTKITSDISQVDGDIIKVGTENTQIMAENDIQASQMDARKQEIDKMLSFLVERQQTIYKNVDSLNIKHSELNDLTHQIQYLKKELDVLSSQAQHLN